MAASRGALLLAGAVVVGIVLLNAADNAPGPQRVTSRTAETTTSLPADVTTTTLPARAPKDVKVLAANGTRVKGAGGKVRDTLLRAGYDALSPTDAPKANSSTAYFTTGYERDAVEIARVLGLPVTAVAPMPTPAPVSDVRGAHVLVVIGPELAGGTGDTTSTTRRTTTTTRATTSTTAAASTTTARPTTSTTRATTSTTRRATTTTAP